MVRRRRLEVAYLLGSLLLLAASLHPTTAYSAPGDPPSGSPAGAVYQLPLEQGRSDAAPKGSGGTGVGAGGGSADATGGGTGEKGEADSLYRTENNFGSSSQVPGVAVAGTGGSGAGVSSASGSNTAAGGNASAGNRAGAASAAIASGTVAAETADTGNASVAAGAVLLGAIGLLAVGVGILSRRFSHGRAVD